MRNRIENEIWMFYLDVILMMWNKNMILNYSLMTFYHRHIRILNAFAAHVSSNKLTCNGGTLLILDYKLIFN